MAEQLLLIFKTYYTWVEVFFAGYLLIYMTFLILSVTIGSITMLEIKNRESLFNVIEHDYYIPVSIIVPAYNEELTIVDTVRSLLETQYNLFEIIVVDDGSNDDTTKMLVEYFKLEEIVRPIRKKVPCKNESQIFCSYEFRVPITVVRKENGGKSDAINMGINISEYPYFICMDADSMLQKDALIKIARPFMENSQVVACGGLVRIINDIVLENGVVTDYHLPANWILGMQVIEYDRTFLASRLFFDKFNGNLIISGAFGIFQKDIVIGVGGYDVDTMGEDMELVVRIHAYCRANNIPYQIKYAPDAICWSQAPATIKDLRTQRTRWHIGLFQSISKHKRLLFNSRYGALSFISFLYFVVYELFSPYIEVFGIITILIANYFNLLNAPFMILFFVAYSLCILTMSLTAFFTRIHALSFKLRPLEYLYAFFLSIIENLFMRPFMSFVRFFALFSYRKKKGSWGKIKRFEHKKADDDAVVED